MTYVKQEDKLDFKDKNSKALLIKYVSKIPLRKMKLQHLQKIAKSLCLFSISDKEPYSLSHDELVTLIEEHPSYRSCNKYNYTPHDDIEYDQDDTNSYISNDDINEIKQEIYDDTGINLFQYEIGRDDLLKILEGEEHINDILYKYGYH